MVTVFFGTPQFAVPSLERLLASPHRVALVVTQPDRPRGRGQKVSESPVKAVARAHGIPVFQPERLGDAGVLDVVRSDGPDLGVVVAYGQLIPEALLRVPRHGMINVHASLLPKYRGAAPVHRAILEGERETGVTIMQVVKALDAGDMLATAVRPIGPDETSVAVERSLADLGADLLLDVIDRMERGLTPRPQDAAAATYARRLTKDEGLIDWSLPARRIHDRVRGLHPWPHAYSYLDGSRVIVLRTRVADHPPGAAAARHEPGTIVEATAEAIVVTTGEGLLAIVELQPEGRRPMEARDYLAGRPIRAGARFAASAPEPGTA